MTIEWLTFEHFAGREGESFAVRLVDGSDAPLTLDEAVEGTEAGGRGPEGQERRQFSLIFRGTAALAQGTHALAHPELGGLELFLVPIGREGDETRYEAAFA